MAILLGKVAFILLLGGVALARAEPVADIAELVADEQAAEDEAVMDSRFLDSDFDYAVDNNGDEFADEYNAQILLAGRRGAAPGFWNSVKNAAAKAGKFAAKTLATAALKTLEAHTATRDADSAMEMMSAVAEKEFQEMGKRLAEQAVAAAERSAEAYGNPSFWGTIKSGARKVWSHVKPIAKEIGHNVVQIVSKKLTSLANSKRTAEDMQELARFTAQVAKRASRDLAHATALAIQAETNSREPQFVHGNMRSARAAWDALNTASVNMAKTLVSNADVFQQASKREPTANDAAFDRVANDVASALTADTVRAVEEMKRAPAAFFHVPIFPPPTFRTIGIARGASMRDPDPAPFLLGSLIGMVGKGIVGAISHAIHRKREASTIGDIAMEEFDRDSDVEEIADAMLTNNQGALSRRDADPGFLDVMKKIGTGVFHVGKSLLGFRRSEGIDLRETNPFLFGILGKLVKNVVQHISSRDALQTRDTDPFFGGIFTKALKAAGKHLLGAAVQHLSSRRAMQNRNAKKAKHIMIAGLHHHKPHFYKHHRPSATVHVRVEGK
ncbi:uncharacterized protein LOC135829392 isoform X2 [Sycon ciliatum]|uniref:uncharacterized protein LOC135829392 isoform X2 n=1 Tax=Sycon ciliatum TaxID=27933 RepID=UPI0031F6C605